MRRAGKYYLAAKPTSPDNGLVGCNGKRQYPTKTVADKMAANARRKADHHVNAYRCQHCTWWHVGTPQFPRSGGRPRIDEAMLDELPRRLR